MLNKCINENNTEKKRMKKGNENNRKDSKEDKGKEEAPTLHKLQQLQTMKQQQ